MSALIAYVLTRRRWQSDNHLITRFAGWFNPALGRTMFKVPQCLVEYHQSGKSLVCELDANPYCCEFWALGDLVQLDREYQVAEYALGYLGFATNGGGEMFAISPTGSIVCLPFIDMEPSTATEISPNWQSFEVELRNAI